MAGGAQPARSDHSRAAPQLAPYPLSGDRQLGNANADRVIDGIGDSGSDAEVAQLPYWTQCFHLVLVRRRGSSRISSGGTSLALASL